VHACYKLPHKDRFFSKIFSTEVGHDFWKDGLIKSLNKKGIGLQLLSETGMEDRRR
jgi:hypothetical protein